MYSRFVRVSLPLIFSFVLLALGMFLLSRPTVHANPNYDCATVSEIPQLECEALIALYNATDGSNWTDSTDWLITNTPCTWYGVNCSLGHVFSLYYRNNQLSGSVPPEIGNLGKLRELNLSNNQLTSLPPEIGNLSNLTWLYLWGNQLTSLPPEIGNVGSILGLYELSLENNQLTNLPPEIGNLNILNRLDLSNNQLTSLPSEISNLSNLAFLTLGGNQLTSLPSSFGNFPTLMYLGLQSNQLASLPSNFGDLSNLVSLSLYGNQLTSLPAGFGNLANLTDLNLGKNLLTSLPAEFGNLSSLTSLTSQYTQLTSLPSEFGNLSNLTNVILTNNPLTSLPPEIGNLSNLTNLYLWHNQLTDLPPSIGNLSSLEYLSLQYNQLTNLPSEIGNLSSLVGLGLSGNQLTNLPPSISSLPSLTGLILDNNQLNGAIPTELTNLTTLDEFYFYETSWCMPDTPAFTAWIASITTVQGTGLVCGRDTGSVSGVISNIDNAPLLATQATLYRDVGGSSWSRWIRVDMAPVNNAGQYVFNNLGQDIDYRVHFEDETGNYAPEYYDNIGQIDAATAVTVTLGITRTGINAVLELPQPPLVDINAGTGSVNINPVNGTVTVNMTQGNPSDITVTRTVTCTGGVTPSAVDLLYITTITTTYPMSSIGNQQYLVTIPEVSITGDAALQIKTTCGGTEESITVGSINLYDPSGNITNLFTHQPIVGATVTLYQVSGWRARTSPTDNDADTCESNDSKVAGTPWSQPAPIDEGGVVNTDLTTVSPLLSHQQTDVDGHYGWDVPSGCWYVVVRADGYETLTSPIVGIPPEVTDLNLVLTPEGSSAIYLPMIVR